ncbi:MAG TPA: hypothetical protein VGB82_20820 [Alphaproteobacteria bacterium]
MDDRQIRLMLEELFPERVSLFRKLTWSLLSLIAFTFILMLWVLGSPDPYHEHLAEQPPSATWPDGSPKTANDWWANPALAQQPAPQPAAQQPPAPPGG